MSYVWDKIKGRVDHAATHLKPFSERDIDEDDTAISRALLRYYGPNSPGWLPDKGPIGQQSSQSPQYNGRAGVNRVPRGAAPAANEVAPLATNASSTSLHDILNRNRSNNRAAQVNSSVTHNARNDPRAQQGQQAPASPLGADRNATGTGAGRLGTPGRSRLASKLKSSNW